VTLRDGRIRSDRRVQPFSAAAALADLPADDDEAPELDDLDGIARVETTAREVSP
jgi:hypothetical protein